MVKATHRKAVEPFRVIENDGLAIIAQSWGWNNPTKEVLRIAQQAHEAKSMMSAELLVKLGVVSSEQKDKILASKPDNIQTITWFAQQDGLTVPVERVLALKNGYAFYELLSQLTIHPCMLTNEVFKRAEELDAAVMLIEDTCPVIVFSTFSSLLKFRSLGRMEKVGDAIMKSLSTEPQMAIGSRDEISGVLKAVRASDEMATSLESTNIWNAEAPENKHKPENREITRLLDHALKLNATDIALKPFRNGEVQIQLRKFGQLIFPKAVSQRMNPDVAGKVTRLLLAKSGANPESANLRIPTDGQITYRSAVGDAFLRLSFIPLNHLGEMRNLTSVSIRLLPRSESSVSLDELHLDPTVVSQIHFAMRMSQGLVLVVGPTNSGKSTTVAGCIGEHVKIFGDTQKRMSVEDPIERFLYGITQINAPHHNLIKEEGERFGIILRAIKRHDPDMISIGEVRDKMTADMCAASASTGHLVVSTLHANHTVMGFDVLVKTVEPDLRFQLVESLSLIISQRLVKVLCKCRRIAAPTEQDRKLFRLYLNTIGEEAELPDQIAHANPDGCEVCGGGGYVDLLPINEVLPFTRQVKDAAIEMMNGGNCREVLANARTITLLQSSLQLLREHKVDFNDLLI